MTRLFLPMIVAGLLFTGLSVQNLTGLTIPGLINDAKAQEVEQVQRERRKKKRRKRRAERALNQALGSFRPDPYAGAQIIIVAPGGETEGYEKGDAILSVKGQPVGDEYSLAEYIYIDDEGIPRQPGTEVELIVRDGATGAYEVVFYVVPDNYQ